MLPVSGDILHGLLFCHEDGGDELSPCYQKVKGERTLKSDITTESCVKYVNRQPSDPVAFNDYHVADDVQDVASKCV